MIRMAEVLKEVQKKQGSEIVQRIGDMRKRAKTLPRFSSGSLIINHMLGGGWPIGRIIELIGQEGSGKTTLALHAIAEVQKAGGQALFIDMEHALDNQWATGIGVDLDALYFSTPDCGENALSVVEASVQAEDLALIVVDSVSALVPRAELEGDMGDSHMGLHARLMGQAMRKIIGPAAKYGTSVIFTNQIRYKIGVVYGSPETTSGGQALKFFSSIRVKVTRGSQITEGTDVIGNKMKLFTMKNKTAPPFQTKEVDLYYHGGGIRADGELAQLMLDCRLIYKNGSMYTLPHQTDLARMKKEGPESESSLSDALKEYKTAERQKVRGYSEVLKSLRMNLNLQKGGKEVLKIRGVI